MANIEIVNLNLLEILSPISMNTRCKLWTWTQITPTTVWGSLLFVIRRSCWAPEGDF